MNSQTESRSSSYSTRSAGGDLDLGFKRQSQSHIKVKTDTLLEGAVLLEQWKDPESGRFEALVGIDRGAQGLRLSNEIADIDRELRALVKKSPLDPPVAKYRDNYARMWGLVTKRTRRADIAIVLDTQVPAVMPGTPTKEKILSALWEIRKKHPIKIDIEIESPFPRPRTELANLLQSAGFDIVNKAFSRYKGKMGMDLIEVPFRVEGFVKYTVRYHFELVDTNGSRTLIDAAAEETGVGLNKTQVVQNAWKNLKKNFLAKIEERLQGVE